MEAEGLEIKATKLEKDLICSKCISNQQILKSTGVFGWKMLDSYYESTVDDALIPDIDQIESIVELLQIEFQGINVGKIAIYETLIKYKKSHLEFSFEELQHFRVSFINCCKVIMAATRFLKSNHFDVLICYSPQYGIPGSFSEVASKLGIRTIFIEGSSSNIERYSRLRMWDWKEHGLNQPGLSNLDEFTYFRPRVSTVIRVLSQIYEISRARAFSVYSTKRRGLNTRAFFNIKTDTKVILVCMSSYDEVFSGYVVGAIAPHRYNGSVFVDQISWLRSLIDWASIHPEIAIIIRPHPREVSNKRESRVADHVEASRLVFSDLPENVSIDWPDLKVSLYDHFRSVDVVTTGWSFSGIEAMLRGIPLVTYDSTIATYPEEIHFSGKSASAYFENLENALREDKSLKRSLNAIRWLSYLSERGTVRNGGLLEDRLIFLKFRPMARIFRSRFIVNSYIKTIKNMEARVHPPKTDKSKISRILDGSRTSLFSAEHLKKIDIEE